MECAWAESDNIRLVHQYNKYIEGQLQYEDLSWESKSVKEITEHLIKLRSDTTRPWLSRYFPEEPNAWSEEDNVELKCWFDRHKHEFGCIPEPYIMGKSPYAVHVNLSCMHVMENEQDLMLEMQTADDTWPAEDNMICLFLYREYIEQRTSLADLHWGTKSQPEVLAHVSRMRSHSANLAREFPVDPNEWSDEDDALLAALCSHCPIHRSAAMRVPGKSRSAVRSRIISNVAITCKQYEAELLSEMENSLRYVNFSENLDLGKRT